MNKETNHSAIYQLTQRTAIVTLVAATVLAALFITYQSSSLFLSALIGIGIASLMNPAISTLESRFNVPRFVGALSILLVGAGLLAIAFFLVGSVLVDQFDSFRQSVPQIVEQWNHWWQKLASKYPNFMSKLSVQDSGSFMPQILGYMPKIFNSLSKAGTGLSLAFVIALFGASNSKNYYRYFKTLAPDNNEESYIEQLELVNNTLRKWFKAQLMDMLAVGILTTLGLWIVGIDYWALYGLLAGLLSIIPFVGILTVVIFAGIIIMATQPDRLPWLMAVFVVTQQLEGNFILPKLMKDEVHIPAAPLIFLMLLAGTWLGILGVLVTPPVLAISIALITYRRPELKTDEVIE